MENFCELVPDSFFEDLSDGQLECGPASTEPVVAPSIMERVNRRARNLRDICKGTVLPKILCFSASPKKLSENYSLAQFQP